MMRPTRRQWLLGMGAGALIGGGYIWTRFRQAVGAANRRVAGRSSTIATPFGKLEYAIAGSGPPLLMIHGTGGGFDQGLRFASALRRLGHRIIAPSRFGYLRSDFPADPSLSNQADALATLLDHLAIDRLAVAGGSAGALSATAFALQHPDRCSALILLVPAANVDGSDPVEMSGLQEAAVRMLLTSDFAYWSAINTAPETLIGTLLATDPALLPKVSQAERARAFAIVSDIMPIGTRATGMLNDAKQAGHSGAMDFSQLRMPVLLISAEDDRFGTAATARKIAAVVPQAELTILPDGGHIWLGHDDQVAQRMHRFLALSVQQQLIIEHHRAGGLPSPASKQRRMQPGKCMNDRFGVAQTTAGTAGMFAESDDNFRKISQSSFRYSTLKFARQIKGAVLPKTGAAQS